MTQKQKKAEELAEAHLKKLKVPNGLEKRTKSLVTNMISHECFGNTE